MPRPQPTKSQGSKRSRFMSGSNRSHCLRIPLHHHDYVWGRHQDLDLVPGHAKFQRACPSESHKKKSDSTAHNQATPIVLEVDASLGSCKKKIKKIVPSSAISP